MWTAEEIKNYKIRDEHDKAIFKAYGLLRDRVSFYNVEAPYSDRDADFATAYENACTMLEYAMTDNWECLNQFDYFKER